MTTHEHRWENVQVYSDRFVLRYLCPCGHWGYRLLPKFAGWRKKKPLPPIRAYATKWRPQLELTVQSRDIPPPRLDEENADD